jgi:type I restriction enzyme R subunit
MKTGQESYIDRYPTPDELWNATFSQVNQWRDKFAEVPFEDLNGTKELRYYQHNAVKNFLEALCQGKDRILLTLATGTGKTFIAFQIAWKLFQSRWTVKQFRGIGDPNQSRRPRILFLADRNILAQSGKTRLFRFSR